MNVLIEKLWAMVAWVKFWAAMYWSKLGHILFVVKAKVMLVLISVLLKVDAIWKGFQAKLPSLKEKVADALAKGLYGIGQVTKWVFVTFFLGFTVAWVGYGLFKFPLMMLGTLAGLSLFYFLVFKACDAYDWAKRRLGKSRW